jgi:hypothetical protein
LVLIGLGISRPILALIDSAWSLRTVRFLSFFYISPYPKVFDHPSYFSSYKYKLIDQTGAEYNGKLDFGGIDGPWLRRVVVSHGFKDLPNMRPNSARQFAKYYLCSKFFLTEWPADTLIKKATMSVSYRGHDKDVYSMEVECTH